MGTPLTRRLYLRIWLAVVGAIVLLTLIFSWIWRQEAERERAQRPGRNIVLRNAQGEVLGQAQARPVRVPGQGLEFEVPLRDGQTVFVQLPRPGAARSGPPPQNERPSPDGFGGPLPPPPEPWFGGPPPPEFRPDDATPRGARTGAPAWWEPPYNLLGLLALVAAAVALGAYPIVRRLTKRLEALTQGVERWGEGDLARRLPEDGQDEVAFLAQRFNIAAERVQALLLSHKALLANASHELRSPLARIRMGLELMQSQPSPAAHEEIARNIRELDQLIDEILLASRLDASPDDLGPLEPVDLVGLSAEECARTGAEFETAPGVASVVVPGLTRLLRRVLRNLLENARRHGGGTVTLTLRTEGELAEILVCDRGPGVPVALRERIFEPFFRLPGASEREGGVGLGLALVRSIAQRHGGSVECQERPGGGACFVLRLPLAR